MCAAQVLGTEMLQTKDPEKTFACLIEHVAAVRSTHPALHAGHVVIIVERNLGFEAEHLYRYCRHIPNSSFLRECNSTRIGITAASLLAGRSRAEGGKDGQAVHSLAALPTPAKPGVRPSKTASQEEQEC